MDTETKSTWWSSPNEESDVSACPIIGLRRSELRYQIYREWREAKTYDCSPDSQCLSMYLLDARLLYRLDRDHTLSIIVFLSAGISDACLALRNLTSRAKTPSG